MSRQIQIRRGTADQHKTFTGAQGELTMDTTNNTLRLHDGATPGGVALARADAVTAAAPIPDNYDFVIESWISADNNTWYRKYKSGWVEQGGYVSIGKVAAGVATTAIVQLPLAMANSEYYVQTSASGPDYFNRLFASFGAKTSTNFYVGVRNVSNDTSDITVCWHLEGVCA